MRRKKVIQIVIEIMNLLLKNKKKHTSTSPKLKFPLKPEAKQ